MPNPQRTRHKTTGLVEAHTGFCQRGNYMWNGEMLYNTFDLITPSYENAYHHQIDTVGYKRNYFNPCWHLHVVLPSKGITQIHYSSGWSSLGPGYSELNFTHPKGLQPERLVEHVFQRIDEFPEFSMWLDDFSVKAEHHFKTAMDDGLSLINLILETIKLLEGNVDTARKFIEKLMKAVKAFKDMYKRTGNYWLSWNFCIKPTIRDLKELVRSLEKARKRLRWLKKRNHIPTMVKYREKPFEKEIESFQWPVEELRYVDPNNPNAFDTFRGGLDGQVAWKLNGMIARCEPAANALIRFDIDDAYLDETYGLGVFWSALNGLYNPLEIAWEALPFSWLIDWFLSERAKMLKKLADLSPLKDATILQWGHSLKWSIRGELSYVDFFGSKQDYNSIPQTDFGRPMETHLGPIEITFYRRVPEIPSTGSSVFRLPLEWYNASIILALIAQKRRRKK